MLAEENTSNREGRNRDKIVKLMKRASVPRHLLGQGPLPEDPAPSMSVLPQNLDSNFL